MIPVQYAGKLIASRRMLNLQCECRWPKGTPHAKCNQVTDIVSAPGTGYGKASWKPGLKPELNFERPPRKDTVVIPPGFYFEMTHSILRLTVLVAGGYVVIRFIADNPGWWHLHCHMAHHLQSGMGMMLNEAPELQGVMLLVVRLRIEPFVPAAHFPPPAGFPKCRNFDDSASLASEVDEAQRRWEQLMHKEVLEL